AKGTQCPLDRASRRLRGQSDIQADYSKFYYVQRICGNPDALFSFGWAEAFMTVGSSGYWVNHSSSCFVVELFMTGRRGVLPRRSGETLCSSGCSITSVRCSKGWNRALLEIRGSF